MTPLKINRGTSGSIQPCISPGQEIECEIQYIEGVRVTSPSQTLLISRNGIRDTLAKSMGKYLTSYNPTPPNFRIFESFGFIGDYAMNMNPSFTNPCANRRMVSLLSIIMVWFSWYWPHCVEYTRESLKHYLKGFRVGNLSIHIQQQAQSVKNHLKDN